MLFVLSYMLLTGCNKHIIIKRYNTIEKLSAEDQELIDLAVSQLDTAYAPYSNFHVGSALRLANGKTFLGSNQENASYPLCMCAERVAIYNASIYEPTVPIVSIAITARNTKKTLKDIVSPCGACRQVISEYEKRHTHKIRVILYVKDCPIVVIDSCQELLPFSFSGDLL